MRYSFLAALLLLPSVLFAESVDRDRAGRVADAFWQSSPLTRSSSGLELVYTSDMLDAPASVFSASGARTSSASGQAPAWYVYANPSGPGFVIVSGDDAAEPVLGYSYESEFPGGQLPPNFRDWLVHVGDQIEAARTLGVTASAEVAAKWGQTRAGQGQTVISLETADWDQSDPYWDLCPMISGLNTYTGCTATALAIVMRYYEWPQRGSGYVPGYTTATNRVYVDGIRLGHEYDWDNMPLSYSGYTTSEQQRQVAVLMRDCGVMLQSDYCPAGSSGTGAYPQNIPQVLSTYMDYDKSARYLNRDDYSTDQWHSMVKSELDREVPVYYTGYGDGGGHAFLLDGYTTEDYFGLNWGWSGYYNGWFKLDALDPEGLGAGGGSGGFNEGQGAIFGLKQDEGGDYVDDIGFTEYTDGSGKYYFGLASDREVAAYQEFNLSYGLLYNRGNADFAGDFKIAVVDHEGNVVQTLSEWSAPASDPLKPMYGYALTIPVTVTCAIESGYRIRALWRSDRNPEWTPATGNEEKGCVWDLLLAEEYFEPLDPIDETTSLSYSKKDKVLRLSVPEDVTVSLFDASGNDISRNCLVEGTEVSINTMLLPAGPCRLELSRGTEVKRLTFTITAAEETAVPSAVATGETASLSAPGEYVPVPVPVPVPVAAL